MLRLLRAGPLRIRSRKPVFFSSRNCASTEEAALPKFHVEMEKKWSQTWKEKNQHDFTQNPSSAQQEGKLKNNKDEKPFHYVLSMFPYPSGKLHMGHVRVYTISDVIARSSRMLGKKVINPIGWDSFGLPAENAARQNNVSASSWTEQNIKDMTEQLKPLGINFQWGRELKTSSEEYYKWTQWIFLQLHKNGLAYQKNSYVNWDPVDQTVLANEQVLVDGTSWRSGAMVEKRAMNQWYFKISEYADRLLSGLDGLKKTWPSPVLALQRNWIGKPSKGTTIHFNIFSDTSDTPIPIEVFSTKPETIYGASFIGISPHHQIFHELSENSDTELEWKASLQTLLNKSVVNRFAEKKEDEEHMQTIPVVGYYAVHPLTGARLPVVICSYVLDDYGTGAVMGVPAHDTRDHIVAKTYHLPIKTVLSKVNKRTNPTAQPKLMHSESFTSMKEEEARTAISESLKEKEKGYETTMYRIRDWLVSRQRYWGAPIPIIHCGSCGAVPVPEHDLPVSLPTGNDGTFNSLSDIPEWYNTSCPKCGQAAKRDTDTMDTFVDSSWYYMRYIDPHNTKEIVERKKAEEFLPVDLYIGGDEHAILHLLYARFIHKFLSDKDVVVGEEPFSSLLTQGMVHGQTFRLADTGRYLKPSEISLQGNQPVLKEYPNQEIEISFEKMSKSKFNGLQPQTLIDEFGADTVRLYILFKAPPAKVLEWDHKGIVGQYRWIVRLKTLVQKYMDVQDGGESKEKKEQISPSLEKELDVAVRMVTSSLTKNHSFNVAIASLMKLSNVLARELDQGYSGASFLHSLKQMLVMLSPMAPFISEQLWHDLHHVENSTSEVSSVHDQPWPKDLSKQKQAESTTQKQIVVQLDGKTKGRIPFPDEITFTEENVFQFVQNHPNFSKTFSRREIDQVRFLSGVGVINIQFKK